MKRKIVLILTLLFITSAISSCNLENITDNATLEARLEQAEQFLATAQSELNAAQNRISELQEGNYFDPGEFLNWYNESENWMTVANGYWSSDPNDKITDAELELILTTAMKTQSAVHWTPYFMIAVKDVEEQRKIIGNAWGDPNDMATEGTVTILVMADQILTQEEGHASPYEGRYTPTTKYAYYDSGMASSLLQLAANSLGYNTHYFGSINGEYAPFDLADGKYQSLSRYVENEYTRTWGFMSPYNGVIDEEYTYPVGGNCVFVCAIVIGKPVAGESIETWGTNHARPQNWAIWD